MVSLQRLECTDDKPFLQLFLSGRLEAQFPDAEPTFAQVTETIWALRQSLTAGVAQTIVESLHHEEQRRASLRCATCMRRLKVRPAVPRLVQTLLGAIEVQRPYVSCRHCHHGRYPLDERLERSAGRMQRDRHQAAGDVATE